ncbi:MAG: threonine ammonia-lyase [Actinobacteria bacterium QS_8_72_14]|nr:MAG: threonine ammonia-lyase [Actinobacteria bacterium QS_8_72_14]
MDLLSLADIEAAAQRIRPLVQPTPVEPSRAVSAASGVRTLLKCEHLQRTGSFKIRGAAARITRLSDQERARGVVCASAGNHGQGVALSAAGIGVPVTVFMPTEAPLPKVAATRGYGAEVVQGGDSFADAYAASTQRAEQDNVTYVHPFDHPDVIAGQGTLGLDVLEQVPDVASVVVPVGGGGLLAGVATAIAARKPDCRIVGVEAAGAAALSGSLAAGRVTPWDSVSSIADGIAVARPGELALAHVRQHVDEVVTVGDDAIVRAVLLLVERAKQVVEPAGAAGLAAVLDGGVTLPQPCVVVLSGGNVDPLLLVRLLQSGMGEEGRYVSLRTRLQDRPGALSTLLAHIAGCGANVIAVNHHRLGTRLDLHQVEVALELEARGPEHIRELTHALVEAGYPLQ